MDQIREHYYRYFPDLGRNSLDIYSLNLSTVGLWTPSPSSHLAVAWAVLTANCRSSRWRFVLWELLECLQKSDAGYWLLIGPQVFSHIISPRVKTKNSDYPPTPPPSAPCDGTRGSAAYKVINFTTQKMLRRCLLVVIVSLSQSPARNGLLL